MTIAVARALATISPMIKSAGETITVDGEANRYLVRDILKWTATPEGREALRQAPDVKDKLYDFLIRLL